MHSKLESKYSVKSLQANIEKDSEFDDVDELDYDEKIATQQEVKVIRAAQSQGSFTSELRSH